MGYDQAIETLDIIENAYKDKKELPHGSSDFGYYAEKLRLYTKTLFEEFAPLRVGDRVALNRTVKMTENNPGWHGCKEFLIKNAIATVREVDYSDRCNCFTVSVIFDIESWMWEGKERPCSNKHLFHFRADRLRKIHLDEEELLIRKEPRNKRKIRVFDKVRKTMLDQNLIEKEYDTSDYNTLGKWFTTPTQLTDLLQLVNWSQEKPKRLKIPRRLSRKWKEVSLEEFVEHLI